MAGDNNDDGRDKRSKMADHNNDDGRDKMVSDIERVANLIDLCILEYMTKDETAARLFKEHNVEPCYTEIVWNKLIEENEDFFKKYYVRLKFIKQVKRLMNIVARLGIDQTIDSMLRQYAGSLARGYRTLNGTNRTYNHDIPPQHIVESRSGEHNVVGDVLLQTGSEGNDFSNHNCIIHVPCPPTTNPQSLNADTGGPIHYPDTETPTGMLYNDGLTESELQHYLGQGLASYVPYGPSSSEQAMMMAPVIVEQSPNDVDDDDNDNCTPLVSDPSTSGMQPYPMHQ